LVDTPAAMGTLTALMLTAPLFGMTLHIDASMLEAPAVLVDPGVVLAVEVSTELEEPKEPTTAELIKKRNKIKKVHKWFGISTWSLMTLSVVSGFIQFHNQYGWWQSQATNPCVQGSAIFTQDACSGVPIAHATLIAVTSAAYFTTFGLSFAMPDPLGVSEGNSDFARKLRTHKVLRWVTFAGMIAQIGLGIASANSERFGLDRANDYKALRGLATAHMAVSLVTYGAMTWAGAIMIF
jgi:cytochrome b561